MTGILGQLAFTALEQVITGGYGVSGNYYTGGFNNCIFDQVNCDCSQGQNTQASNNGGLGILAGLGVLGLAAWGTAKIVGNSNDKKEVQQKYSALEKEINTELEKIGATEDNYETKISDGKKLISDYEATDKAVTARNTKIGELTSSIETLKGQVGSAQAEIDAQDAILNNPNSDAAAITAATNAKAVAVAKRDALIRDQGEKEAELARVQAEQETDERKLSELTTQYNALKVKTATELDKIGSTITSKLNQLKELANIHLENADGTEFNRTASWHFKSIFDDGGEEVLESHTVTKRNIREAIAQYRNNSGEAQELAAKRLQNLWENAGEDVTSDATLNTAYRIISKEANLDK